MTPQDRAEIDRAVREEIRACALTDEPAGLRPMPPRDLDAESAVLAAMFEGVGAPAGLEAEDFWSELHRCLFITFETMHERGVKPTLELATRAIASCGVAATRIEDGIHRAVNGPICVDLEEVTGRIVTLARRRRALRKHDYLRAVLLEPSSTEEQIAAAEAEYRAARAGAR
jgi:replicative DNA helicase